MSAELDKHGFRWAQQWDDIFDIVAPYKTKASVDVTDEMRRQNYTPDKMFHSADEFFQSIGFDPMTATFWKSMSTWSRLVHARTDTVMTKPADRTIVCHASAWDMFADDDFRIKMCTQVSIERCSNR
jgi:peptidyl-dipeptidase A